MSFVCVLALKNCLLLLSGKVPQIIDSHNTTIKRKFVSKSGSALVQFFSDKNLHEEGFNITYRFVFPFFSLFNHQ